MTQIDHENVQATAAKAIFDLFHLYGLEAFRPQAPPTQTQEETSGDTAEEPGNSTATLSQLIPGDGDGDAEGGDGEGEDGDGLDKATQQILHLLADYLDSEVTYQPPAVQFTVLPSTTIRTVHCGILYNGKYKSLWLPLQW